MDRTFDSKHKNLKKQKQNKLDFLTPQDLYVVCMYILCNTVGTHKKSCHKNFSLFVPCQ